MRLRFTQSVTIPGGPSYRPGDVADTDTHFIPLDRAADLVRRGWAREEPGAGVQAPAQAPAGAAPRVPEAAPEHRMVTRSQTKSTGAAKPQPPPQQ